MNIFYEISSEYDSIRPPLSVIENGAIIKEGDWISLNSTVSFNTKLTYQCKRNLFEHL